MSTMNQVILVIIIKFLEISTHGFCDGLPSFFFHCDDMPGKFESLYYEVRPGHKYSTDGGDF